MKKWMLLVVVVVLVALVALVPAAFAQGPADGYGPGDGSAPMFNGSFSSGPGFVDQDGDGVCDNFVDEDGDGTCDLAGMGHGAGFVGEDGDGVCDHADSGPHGGGGQSGHHSGAMGRWAQ